MWLNLGYLKDLVSGDEFQTAVCRLFEAERIVCGFQPEGVEFQLASNKSDGGVDVLVSKTPPSPTDFLRGPTVVQVKKSWNLTKLKSELRSKQQARARALLSAGAEYTLVVCEDRVVTKKEDDALQKFLVGLLKKKVKARVLWLSQLARWFEQHIAIACSLPGFTTGARPWSFEDWERPFTTTWVEDQTRRAARQRVEHLASGEVFRISGAPGCGTTRLALEALRMRHASVAYLPAYRPDVEVHLGGSVALYGTLVIDDCTAEEHRRIQHLHRGATLTVVTLGRDGGDVHLEPLTIDARDELAVQGPAEVPLHVRRALAQKSGGFPQLYQRLCSAVRGTQPASIDSVVKALVDQLAGGANPVAVNALGLLPLVSLTDDSPDLPVLAKAFEVSEPELLASSETMRRAGLIGTLGQSRYVKPPLLGDWLALNAWGPVPLRTLDALIAAGADARFIERALELLSRGSVELIDKLKELLTEPQVLVDAVGIAMVADHLATIAWRHPRHAVEMVRQLLAKGHWDERLGHALGRAAWWETEFRAAARLMAAALAPRADATFFTDLFGVRSGLTRAEGQDRLDALDELMNDASAERRRLAARAVASALHIDRATMRVFGGAPGQPNANEHWRPATRDEERQYVSALVGRLAKLLGDEASIQAEAARAVEGLRALFQSGHASSAELLVQVLIDRGLNLDAARRYMRQVIDFDLERLDPDSRVRAKQVSAMLAPRTLRDRLIHLSTDFAVGLPQMAGYATELLAEVDPRPLLRELIDAQAGFSFALGTELARQDTDRRLLPTLVELARANPKSVRLQAGYAQLVGEAELTQWEKETSLASLLFEALVYRPPSAEAGAQLRRLLQSGLISPQWFEAMLWPKWLPEAAAEVREPLVGTLIDRDPVAALKLVRQLIWQFEGYAKKHVPADIAGAAKRAWATATLVLDFSDDDFDWFEVARWLSKADRSFVTRACVEALVKRPTVPLFLGKFAAEMASPWAPLGDALMSLGEKQPAACIGFRGKLPESLTAQVMEWVGTDRARATLAAMLVGQNLDEDPTLARGQVVADRTTNLAAALLERFPREGHIGFLIYCAFDSGMFRGEESAWKADKVQTLDELARSKRSGLAAWAKHYRTQLQHEYMRAAEEDTARAHGAIDFGAHQDRSIWARVRSRAEQQDGYFTTRQAKELACSGPLLRRYVKSRKIRQVLHGVYRVNDWPVGETDELVPIWLWAKGRGTFSHTTALALHQLSDAMPTKLHLTVPLAWSRRRLKVPPNVILHYGDVTDAERAHVGPVRVTTVQRTLDDCVGDHIDPEIVADALEQAKSEGRIGTEAS